MVTLLQEDSQLLAENRAFFKSVEHEHKNERECHELTKPEREEMFEELDELSDEDEEMFVDDDEADPSST